MTWEQQIKALNEKYFAMLTYNAHFFLHRDEQRIEKQHLL